MADGGKNVLQWVTQFENYSHSWSGTECVVDQSTPIVTRLQIRRLRNQGSIPDRGKIIFLSSQYPGQLLSVATRSIILHPPVSPLHLFPSYGAWLTGRGGFTCYLCYVYFYLWNVGLWYEQFVCSVRKEINSDDIVERCGMAVIILTSSCSNWDRVLKCLKAESFHIL
jgi:hypothetical protein